jgi:Icc-related predicted phosphoesterase
MVGLLAGGIAVHLPVAAHDPVVTAGSRILRIAAIADLHCTKTSQGAFHALVSRINECADILLVCGDLLNYGLPEEAHVLARELSPLKIPVVAVLGNHDVESGHEAEVSDILTGGGMVLLDGSAYEFNGVGIAGVKGFIGGFGERSLQPWGEETIKRLVRDTVDEAIKLESALAGLRTLHRIAILHYAPIRETVEGEPLEIYPFMGSSRMEEPLNRYPVAAVFHGHAHRGSLEGRIKGDIPVFNVAMPLLTRSFPDRPPFRIFELAVPAPVEPASAPSTNPPGLVTETRSPK